MNPAGYATKLRKKLKAGEPLESGDSEWLEKYERMTKRGRKPSPRPEIDEVPSEVAPSSPEPSTSEGAPFEVSGADAGAAPPIDVSAPSSPGGEHPKAGGAAPAGPPPKAEETRKEPDPEHSAMCAGVAKAYGQWLLECHARLHAAGSPSLPPALITEMLVPCCYRAAVAFMPKVNNIYLDAGVTVVAGVGTLVMTRKMGPKVTQESRGKVFHMPAPSKEEVKASPPVNHSEEPEKDYPGLASILSKDDA